MKKWWMLGWATLVAAGGFAAETTLDFTFSAADVELAPAGEYTAVTLRDGAQVFDEAGAPALPAKFVNILLPAGAQNISVTASSESRLLAQGLVPRPAQPRRPKSKARLPLAVPNSRYAAAELWPAAAAMFQGDHEMQGYRFVAVRLNPLAYAGAEQALVLREKITVTATYDVPAAARTVSARQQALFAPLVGSLVVNPEAAAACAPAARKSEPRATRDYLIITSAALSNAFQQIADYRASTTGGGYTAQVITTNTIGTDYTGTDIQAKVRACISNSVTKLGTTLVLLGGDDTIVPDRDCYAYVPDDGSKETNMPTDLYYSGCLSGNWNADGDSIFGETTDSPDMGWDVVVARLPIRTAANVTSYLARVKAYEAGSPAADKIIMGGPEAWDTYSGTSRPSDDVTGDGHAGFRSVNPAHTYVSDSEMWLRRLYRDGIRTNWPATVGLMCDTITSWDTTTNCGSWAQTEANTLTAFNKTWTHLMFSGHGAPQKWGLESGSFNDTNAAAMTGLVAFVYTDACLTGHFDKNTDKIDGDTYTTEPCLAEGFLRNPRTQGGALAYMGCARYGWGDEDLPPAENTSDGGPSTVYAYKFYGRMYETTNRTLGVAFAMHKADMVSLSGAYGCERWIQFGLNLLGDPALKMPVMAGPSNQPPVLDSIGAKAGVRSNLLSFAVTASDPADGDSIRLWATNVPSWAAFPAVTNPGAVTNTFSGTPVVTGVYNVTFFAADKDGTNHEAVAITVRATGGAADLFFSEYVEGSGNNKYLEIFNGTGLPVDLADYTLYLFGNGFPTATQATALSGTLADGEVFVIRNNLATLGVEADLTNNSTMAYSGDDALALSNELKGAYADIFGRIGEDPGTAWTTGSIATVDQTLVRKPSVWQGVTNNPATNFPTLGTEWISYPLDTVSNLGTHVFDGGPAGTPPTVNAIPALNAIVGATRAYTVTATEANGDLVTFACTSAVSAARWTFNTNSGAFAFLPTAAELGARQFTFRASDKDGTSAPVAMNVSVSAPPAVTNWVAPTNGGTAAMQVPTVTGINYALQYTTNLVAVPPVWRGVVTQAGTGGLVLLQDANTTNLQKYYRVVKP